MSERLTPFIYRDARGSIAGEINFDFDPAKNRVMQICAMKRSSGFVVCQASVRKRQVFSDGVAIYTYAPFSDFNKVTGSMKRCTEKNVRDLLDQAMSQVNELIVEARAFYAKEVEA